MLTGMLRKWGYDPLATSDGRAAWAALQGPQAPRLVLLDWNMPGLDGLEVCRRLRADESANPPYIILLTGRGEKGDIVRGLDAGANDYVAKPYHTDELLARIRVGQRMLELQQHLRDVRDAMTFQATHDSLTGILNRRAILDRLAEELSRARRERATLTVGMCDLDHFKRVNDTLGHQAGDEVLAGFAARVQAHLRAYDSVGRYGGEEFLVIGPLPAGRSATGLYERLRARVSESSLSTTVAPVCITISIGVATGGSEDTVDRLLAAADAALYRAKAEGRNRVAYASPVDAEHEPGTEALAATNVS
jgi:diguanylate cyclase (GGDEF)-like protein